MNTEKQCSKLAMFLLEYYNVKRRMNYVWTFTF